MEWNPTDDEIQAFIEIEMACVRVYAENWQNLINLIKERLKRILEALKPVFERLKQAFIELFQITKPLIKPKHTEPWYLYYANGKRRFPRHGTV